MTTKDCQHIVLDAGHISVESNLVDQKALGEVKAKENQEYREEDYQRLESLMYDQFHVKLEDAQVIPTLWRIVETDADWSPPSAAPHGSFAASLP